MKAFRLHSYREPLTVDEVAEPEITGPLDVIVRVGGAGLCRTDLHIRAGPAGPTSSNDPRIPSVDPPAPMLQVWQIAADASRFRH